MAGGTSARSSCFRGVVVLGVNPDGPRAGKLLRFTVARETESIVMVRFDELGSAGSSMGIVAVKAVNTGVKMAALLKVEPLLMLGFRVGSRVSPGSGFELVIVGKGLSYFIRFVILVVPGEFESPVRNAYPR